jgi:hypothetical protein
LRHSFFQIFTSHTSFSIFEFSDINKKTNGEDRKKIETRRKDGGSGEKKDEQEGGVQMRRVSVKGRV